MALTLFRAAIIKRRATLTQSDAIFSIPICRESVVVNSVALSYVVGGSNNPPIETMPYLMTPMPLLLLILICCALPLQSANLTLEQRISEGLDTPALAGKALWLEAEGVRFLAIHSPARSKKRLGGALLLHDAGAHADWMEVIHPLRRYLSAQGWDTLSLQLPATDTRPDALAASTLVNQAAPRIQAAVDHFATQEQRNLVLVGHGLGAAMALNYAFAQRNDAIKGVAAIGVSISVDDEQDPARQAIAQLEIPILDLFGSRDLADVTGSAAERHRVAVENGRDRYRQERVNGADHFFKGLQTNLTHRVHGWMRRVTAGDDKGKD